MMGSWAACTCIRRHDPTANRKSSGASENTEKDLIRSTRSSGMPRIVEAVKGEGLAGLEGSKAFAKLWASCALEFAMATPPEARCRLILLKWQPEDLSA